MIRSRDATTFKTANKAVVSPTVASLSAVRVCVDRHRRKKRWPTNSVTGGSADGRTEHAVLTKIAEMPKSDRVMAERLHRIITASAPSLSPRTWYGMPAYAKDGKVVCFFQSAQKFKTRYATFGFSDKANLDEGAMWPTSFALKELTADVEARIGALVKKAVSED